MSAEEVDRLQTSASEALAQHSIFFESVAIDSTSDHPALEYLTAEAERPLPPAVLVSPTGRKIWLGQLWEEAITQDQAGEGLRSTLDSSVRSRIAEELSTAFAVVLLLEGTDEAKNLSARAELEQAITVLESELEYFPKPIKKGPVMISLNQAEIASEQLLLWSLGVEPHETEEPIAVVLYGRGRWIGPLMIGEEITYDLVSRVLFIVGADCECDLDPRLLRGTAIPLPWSNRLQEVVSKDLGFDPDNPLVRMEVSQIMKVSSWYTARSARAHQVAVPVQEESSGSPGDSLFSLQFLYLIGGLLLLVICLGLVLWIRAAKR
jgi:hypothetical protein